MPETFQNNQIASGANNVAGLVNIEAIAVSGEYFVGVNDLGAWRVGSPVLYGDGVSGTQGFISTRWVSGHITLEQYNYLYTTILSNSISAWVTIKTRALNPATYANYSAILTIGTPDTLNKVLGSYLNFVWTFTRLELIP